MVVVKLDLLAQLKKPISLRLFGRNKTWRGVFVMPILTIIGLWLAILVDKSLNHNYLVNLNLWIGGITLGLFYILGELPNSYWKRRKGISEGKLPSGKVKILHIIVDQADSAISCAIGYYLILPQVDLEMALNIILVGTGLHLLFNNLLYWAGIRKEPF